MVKAHKLAALALTGLILTRPVMAQTDKLTQINALPLSEMCSQNGALAKKFGATDLPPSSTMNRGVANDPLEARFAPFDSIGFSTTKYSNKMYEVVFESRFDDEKSADIAIKAIAARYTASGWTPVIGRELTDAELGQDDIVAILGPGSIDLYLNAADAKTGSGVRVTLQPLAGGVVLSCQNGALMAEQLAEALGEYPADLPRPVAPISKAITPPAPVNCNDAESSKQAIAAFKNSDWMPNPKGAEEQDYQERLAAWKSSKLLASGKVDRESLAERQLELMAASGAIDSLNKTTDDISKLLPEIERLEKLDKAGDTVGLCQGIEKFKAKLEGFANIAGASNQTQWAAVHKFLDTEAMRLGVNFPQ
jgi:hypothetical protein